MEFFRVKVILLVVSVFFALSATCAGAADVLFTSPGTQYINVTFTYAQIQSFSFNVTGSNYSGSYPHNVSIDVGDDGITDWEYFAYNSNISASADSVLSAWSNNPDGSNIYFVNMTPLIDILDYVSLGNIENNDFTPGGSVHDGTLGMTTIDNTQPQIMSITTNSSTIHAFIPSMAPFAGTAGLYIAEGGSTYYCNSEHSFDFISICNLTAEEAMKPAHLAGEANITYFAMEEPVTTTKMTDSINSILGSCSLPCNITIKVTSQTAGWITLSGFSMTGPSNPPNMSVSENSTHYLVDISPSANLTASGYLYGDMPNVYIAPVVAKDDTTALTANQSLRLNMLKDTLREGWDNLTNRSHPLNFNFYMQPFVADYLMGQDNYSVFMEKAREATTDNIGIEYPGIKVIIDIHDYFPDTDCSNTLMDTATLISEISMNGFSDSNIKTSLYGYDSEVLRNLLLHELAHTFIVFPTSGMLFHSGHPGSFTDLDDFTTYDAADSPTGEEGYYEIYSILSQLRPFIAEEDINSIPPGLSILGKMLMGILSPYAEGNHTFYSGNVTRSGYRYSATEMTPMGGESASELYLLAPSTSFWNVISESTYIGKGANTSFSILKSGQDNRALWVFAGDAGNPDHFRVFNLNSSSTQAVLDTPIIIHLISPVQNRIIHNNTAGFWCRASGNASNITLYTDTNGTWEAKYTNTTGNVLHHTIGSIGNGTYRWNCLAYSANGSSYWAESNFTLIIPPYMPRFSKFTKVWPELSDLTRDDAKSVSGLILEIENYGRILFPNPINLTLADLDRDVHIKSKLIGVNTINEKRLNISAQITFFNISHSYPLIYRDGALCDDCIFLSNAGNNVTYNISHFSNYTVGPSSALEIWNSGPAYTNENITFYANYTNITSNELITGASCNITFGGTWIAMSETADHYLYNRTFSSTGDYQYNVSCSKTGFDILNLSDTAGITENSPPAITLNSPEDGYNLSGMQLSFNFTAADTDSLKNATLFGNFSGTWQANSSNQSGLNEGASEYNIINVTALPEGVFVWNAYVCDDAAAPVCGFASANYSLAVDRTAPAVSLESPSNNTLKEDSNTVVFSYNASDSNHIANCSLAINGIVNLSNNTITKDASQNFTLILADGNYTWSVNCTDSSGNTGNSEEYNLSVSYAPDTTAPAYSGIVRNDSAVFQHETVRLNTTWQDSSELNYSVFSTNISGSWQNSSAVPFSGGNVSTNVSRMEAAPGTAIAWMFYANDSSGNMNHTPVQEFTVGGVIWNQTALDLGSAVENDDALSSAVMLYSYLNNTNVNVSCYSGNCSSFTFNFSTHDLNDTNAAVLFNCSTSAAGILRANFSVNSSEDLFLHNISISCNITAFNAAPRVTLNTPINHMNISSANISFNFTANDSSGLKSAALYANFSGTWKVNETNQTALISSQPALINVSNIPDGSFIWNIYACDVLDLCGFALNNFTLTLDATSPSIGFAGGTENNNTLARRDWVFVNVSVSESNFRNITFYLYNSSGLVNKSAYTSKIYSINFTNLPRVVYYYNVTVYDEFNHPNSTETRIIRLAPDIVPPNVTLIAPQNGSTLAEDVSFQCNVIDDMDIANISLYGNWSASEVTEEWGDGISSDHTGTIEDTFTNLNDIINDGQENLNTWSWSSPIPHKVANTIIIKADLSAIPQSAVVTDATLYLYQTDYHGLENTTNTIHKIINKNPVISEVTGFNASSSEQWTAVPPGTTHSDVPLGLADIEAEEDSVIINISNGTKAFSLTSMVQDWVADPGSNYGLLISAENGTSIETGRTFASTENSNASMRPRLVISYIGNSLSLVQNISLGNESDTNYTASFEVAGLTDGHYSWNCLAYDNESGSAWGDNDYILTVDAKNPSIDFAGGTEDNNSNVSRDWVFVNVSVIESNFRNITFYLYNSSGLVNESAYTDSTREINWTGLGYGVYYYNATAYDELDHSNSTETRMIILAENTSLIPPVVQLISPANSSSWTSSSTVEFQYNVTDTDNITMCSLVINDVIDQNDTSIAKGIMQNFTQSLSNGVSNWSVNCTDSFGNTGFSGEYSLNVSYTEDTTAPAYSNIVRNDSAVYQYETVRLNTTWQDDSRLNYSIFSTNISGSWQNSTPHAFGSGNVSTNASFIQKMPGTAIAWMFYANDSSGNMNHTPVQEFRVGGIIWNQTMLDLGKANQSDAQLSSAVLLYSYLNNTNVNVACYSGNCSAFSINFSTQDINDTNAAVLFNCSTAAIGNFSADFSVNSSEDIFLHNISVICNITIGDSASPSIALNSPADHANLSVSDITLNFTATDSSGIKNATLYANFSGSWEANRTNYTTITSGQPSVINVSGAPDGSFVWNVYACDAAATSNCGFSSSNYSLTIDTTPPGWSGNKTSPQTQPEYSENRDYMFNITWDDYGIGLDTAIIEHNFTGTKGNYTISTYSGSEYYYEYSGIAAGSYEWRSYANDSLGNVNSTTQWTYIVQKAANTCSLSFNIQSPQGYGTAINASCSCSGEEQAVLYRNSSDVTALENNIEATLAAGYYIYNCTSAASQNYTYADNFSAYTINKAALVLNLTAVPGWNITYGTQTTVNCSSNTGQVTPQLYRNNTDVAAPEIKVLAAGGHHYVCNASASQNYTSKTESSILNISKAGSGINLSLNGYDTDITLESGEYADIN
ncbi:DNRLRE domain-containing protein, partial [Candidatus Woesearchaeota archaeon]|nr:DNRLRE domain-containing protein [Candidatus Woesearchaeota archaeon]